MLTLDPNRLKIGYVILISTRKFAIEKLQRKVGYGDSSKWTHIAGSLGGLDVIEANIPRSRVINLQKEYIDKGYEIKVVRRRGQQEHKRYKVALWWATMNNLPYDVLQFFWFPLSIFFGKIGIVLHNIFSSRKRFLCSELIATGFYKEGDYLFGKSAENVLPADFDNPELFEEVNDVWMDVSLSKHATPIASDMKRNIRYQKAIIRNLYEIAHALLELKVLKQYEKFRVDNEIWVYGESFFGISERAIYNDMIAHAIKVLVIDKFDSTTFWYILDITKTTGTLLETYSEDKINSLKNLSEKFKIIRDKTHFHIDKIGVLDPHKIWDQANIKGNELEEALQYLFSFLNELHRDIFNKGFLFQPEDYEGKDVSKLLDLANSANLISVIKKNE